PRSTAPERPVAKNSPANPGPVTEWIALRRPLALVAAVVTVGVAGYMLVEGWSLFDALYMVITTITTVGYGEIHPLSDRGRLFTMVLVVVGTGTMLYTLSTIVYYAVECGLTLAVGSRR